MGSSVQGDLSCHTSVQGRGHVYPLGLYSLLSGAHSALPFLPAYACAPWERPTPARRTIAVGGDAGGSQCGADCPNMAGLRSEAGR